MDIKSRFNKIKQLDKNTSRLVIAVSCIALSLLIVYFGVSLTSKGTYSADSNSGYVCNSGTLVTDGNVNLCCPSGYETIKSVLATDSFNSLASNGYVCANSAWVNGSNKHMVRAGVGYCGEPILPSTPLALCEFEEDDYCWHPCAANPSDADLYSCSVDILTCEIQEGTNSDKIAATVEFKKNSSYTSFKYSWTVTNPDGITLPDFGSNITGNSLNITTTRTVNAVNWTNGQQIQATLVVTDETGTVSCTDTQTIDIISCDNCVKCFKCKDDGSGTVEEQSFASCTGDWSSTRPTCGGSTEETITCWYCDDNNNATTRTHTKTANQQTCESFGDYTDQPTCGGSTPDPVPVKEDKCYKTSANTARAVWVQSCTNVGFDSLPPTASCNGINDTSLGTCIISYGNNENDSVPRCALFPISDSACALTCYECQSGLTTPHEVTVTLDEHATETCESHGYVSSQSDLTCSKNCFYCKTGVDGGVKPYSGNPISTEDNCPSGYYENQSSVPCVQKTCHYCNSAHESSSTVVWVTNANTNCDTVNVNYSDTALTCTTTCYRCNPNSTEVEEQPFASCTGDWSSTRPTTCAKTCRYCNLDNGTTAYDYEVPIGKNCSTYDSRYHELDDTGYSCKKICYYCENGSSKADVIYMDTSKKDCTDFDAPTGVAYSDTALTCTTTCYRCASNSTEVEEQQFASCTGDWSSTRPTTCAKTCKYCNLDTGTTAYDYEVPIGKSCSTYDSRYHERDDTDYSCKKICYYCENGSSKADVIYMDTSKKDCTDFDAPTGVEYSNSNLTCSRTCYRCATGTTQVEENEMASCTGGWSSTRPTTCAKTCYYCNNGTILSKNNVPISYTNCSDYGSAYHNDQNFECNPGTITCYHCVDNKTDPQAVTITGDSCSSGYKDEAHMSELTCSTKCYRCQGKSKVETYIPKNQTCEQNDYATSSNALVCDETCYYCDGIHTTAQVYTTVATSVGCPTIPVYTTNDSSLNCKQTCYYCKDGATKSNNNIPKGVDCTDYSDATSSSYAASATDLTCTRTCYYCSNASVTSDSNVPIEKQCSEYDSTYTSNSDLQCDPDVTTCYHCVGNEVKGIDITDGTCESNGYEDSASNLNCGEKIKCCACEGNKSVEKSEVNEGEECPDGETICSEIVCSTPQTGVSAVTVAWIIGLAAIGYSFYYFRKTNKQI